MNRRDLLKAMPALAAVPAARANGKGRLKSAICAYSFRDQLAKKTMTYDDLVRMAVDLDVDGLDLTVYWFPDTSDAFLLPLKRLAYKSGVEIYSISVRTNMCQPTAELQAKELADIRKWIDAAAKLGAGHIRVFGGTVPKANTEDEAAGWVVSVLKRASEHAARSGVILGLENHGGITDWADRIVEIVRKVDSPWVGVNLDTGNFKRDSYAQCEKLVPYAVNVQLKVEVRDAEGKEQPSDWPRFLKMLNAGGYKGYVALEYEAKEDAKVAVPPLISKLRRLIHEA